MTTVRKIRVLALGLLLASGGAFAQVNDGIDDTVIARRVARHDQGGGGEGESSCTGPACQNNPEGIYPQSVRPGAGAKNDSMSGAYNEQ